MGTVDWVGMIPDQRDRGRQARWILVLLIGWTLLALPSSKAASPSPEKLYLSGTTCKERLHRSAKHKKYRDRWEKCIRDFESILQLPPTKSKKSNDKWIQKSLVSLGELYEGLFRYSRNPNDLELSIHFYRRLVSDYPSNVMVKTAKSRIKRLKRIKPPVVITTVRDIRHWAYPNYTRLVLDLDRKATHRKTLKNSNEISIRLDQTRIGKFAQSKLPSLKNGLLKRIKISQSAPSSVSVKINLKGLSAIPKIIPLSNPDRLVIDLFGNRDSPNPPNAKNTPRKSDLDPSSQDPSKLSATFARSGLYDVRTIVIDPGHGGKDPGAVGRRGLAEKDVVLDVGLQLRRLIQNRLGKKVIMTRTNDRFISLNARTLLANSKNADLFISLHVNSHPKRSVRGIEIYHLGQSSDRRALAVAARENNISILSSGQLDKSVRRILFDLGREYNIDQSRELAFYTRQSFKGTLAKRYKYKVVDHGVKRAPFYVLLNSNMPSILAEISFISNSTEEKLLRSPKYRKAITESIFNGIRAYLDSLKPVS